MSTPITAFYASLLAVFFLYLSVHVILERREKKIGLGDGGDRHFLQVMRVHGNFAEYVPFAMVLMLIGELNSVNANALHFAGILLLAGRMLHAFGVRHHFGASWQRVSGGLLTFTSYAVLIALDILIVYR